ncbi:MAG: hypothetical protein QG604_649 [Candidatus Dependentiae bacterium]|nr:hypothetical protein [Candidatus Dependentiae bacterium]
MAQWYVKKLSKLTHVSVKTLYHYESIGLLKPSMRLDNGYRVYTEADLIKLQQILALKSFGFSLTQIKAILSKKVGVAEQLLLQARFLEEKAQSLADASATLKNVAASLDGSTTVAWETVIQLIEVYTMTNELKKSWAGKVFHDDAQLKEYAEFSEGLKTRFTEDDKIAWEKKWSDLADAVRANLANDPSSDIGVAIGQQSMAMVNQLYGKKYQKLRNTIWEEGYKKGKVDPAHEWAEPAVIAWLDKAVKAYYFSSLIAVVNQSRDLELAVVDKQWDALIEETSAQAEQVAIATHLLGDLRVTVAGKKYLKRLIAKA